MSSTGLLPISEASTIIGFIGFAISIATLVRVLWGELATLSDAPNQVHFALSNLKEALWEERDAIRCLTRRHRRNSRRRSSASGRHTEKPSRQYDDAWVGGLDVKILQESVRTLCDQFVDIERPYLAEGFVSSNNNKYDWDGDDTATRYKDDGFENDYGNMNLALRLRWLKTKGQVNMIWVLLNRLQLRRMTREMTGALLELRSLDRELRDLKLVSDHHAPESDREGEAKVHVRRSRGGR